MAQTIIAYCGLTCTDCPAFIATRDNDTEKLKSLAMEWYGEEGDPDYCLCEGCNTEGLKNKHCSNCGVRTCAIQRGVVICAHCDDYGCDTLTGLFQYIPDAKVSLERIRQSL